MTKQLICTRWISGSGKSYWSQEEVANNWAVRFNKDDLRKSLFPEWYIYSKDNENIVISTERTSVLKAIKDNKDYIIIDNTHLGKNNKHIEHYRELAKQFWYEFEIKDFFCPVELAIKRDKDREETVWEDVIRKQIKIAWNGGYPIYPTFKKSKSWLPYCIICDLDWTIALHTSNRSPYDYSRVGEDTINKHLLNLILWYEIWYRLARGQDLNIIFLSWRKSECREETIKWIEDNIWLPYKLYMRDTEDNRPDYVVKKEIYQTEIEDKYNTIAVFDDREQIIDMWRQLWLPTYQVWYWKF